jgi:hypothetical protein
MDTSFLSIGVPACLPWHGARRPISLHFSRARKDVGRKAMSSHFSLYKFFNLSNEHRQIGTGETYLRCRNAVVLHVRWDMLMMRKG